MSRSPMGSTPEASSTEPRNAEAAVSPAPSAQASLPHSPAWPPEVKHCPVCGRTYPRNEQRYYCNYHTAILVEGAPPLPGADTSAPVVSSPRRHLRWPLVVLTLSAALGLGYSVQRHRSRWASLLPAAMSGVDTDNLHEVTAASVVGGVLIGRQIHLPPPEYPAAARAQKITGSVTVEVTVDGAGRVVAARSLDGPEALMGAAEEAAREAKFQARASASRTGTIKYDFMLCRNSEDCM